MNKVEFISALQHGLSAMNDEDIDKTVEFYLELIDDSMEDCLSEEDAIAKLGDINTIIDNTLAEYPLPALIKTKLKPKKELETWQIVLLIATCPIWFGLSIAVISLAFSLVVTVCAVIFAFGVMSVAMPVASTFAIVTAIMSGATPMTILFAVGTLIASIGASILIILALVFFFKNIGGWTKSFVRFVKRKVAQRSNEA